MRELGEGLFGDIVANNVPVAVFASLALLGLAALLFVMLTRADARPRALIVVVLLASLFALDPSEVSERPRVALGFVAFASFVASGLLAIRSSRRQ